MDTMRQQFGTVTSAAEGFVSLADGQLRDHKVDLVVVIEGTVFGNRLSADHRDTDVVHLIGSTESR